MTRLEGPAKDCPLAGALAERLRESREALVRQWLERILDRVTLPAQQVFPTEDLLDHVPLLIDGIADYLEDPVAEVSADTPVVGKAMELGALRHRQGFDAYQIMKEYELLGGILFTHLATAADQMPEPCEKSELLICGHRVFRAISIIQATTTAHFLQLADKRVSERESRLRAFNRLLSHEIKNNIGAILGAADLLQTIPDLTPERRDQFTDIILRHARATKSTLDNLVELSRLENDARTHRHVRLRQAIGEACRQLRETAKAAAVEVRVAESVPDVEVNAAVVELALTNYLSNAIKYRKPGRGDAYVAIEAELRSTARGNEIVVSATDNGLGIPPEKRGQLFERFFRAHTTVTGVEGTGLGLSIVREMIESAGGTAWAEFPSDGSRFLFSLPARRTDTRRSSDASRAAAVSPA